MRKQTLRFIGITASAAVLALSVWAEVRFVTGSPRAERAAAALETRGQEVAGPDAGEKWIGARAIIFDGATKKLRRPTADETADMVRTLRILTARPAAIPGSVRANGSRQGAVEGRFSNVVIARATEDGAMETICVESFDEAVQFLGLELQKPQANQ